MDNGQILEFTVLGIMTLLTALSWVTLYIERKRAIDREHTLLSAILSRPQDAADFGAYLKNMKQSAGDITREMELENEIVLAAAKEQENEEKPVGIPIT